MSAQTERPTEDQAVDAALDTELQSLEVRALEDGPYASVDPSRTQQPRIASGRRNVEAFAVNPAGDSSSPDARSRSVGSGNRAGNRPSSVGRAVIDPAVTQTVIDRLGLRPSRADLQARLDHLTSREREALRLIAHAYTNGEIAQSLVISEGTTKTHVADIFAKLNVRDRAQAIVLAHDAGLRSRVEGRPDGR